MGASLVALTDKKKKNIRFVTPLSVCTVPAGPVPVPENSTADLQVVKISSGSDVTLTVVRNPEEMFYLKGKALMVKKELDYEVINFQNKSTESYFCSSIQMFFFFFSCADEWAFLFFLNLIFENPCNGQSDFSFF